MRLSPRIIAALPRMSAEGRAICEAILAASARRNGAMTQEDGTTLWAWVAKTEKETRQ